MKNAMYLFAFLFSLTSAAAEICHPVVITSASEKACSPNAMRAYQLAKDQGMEDDIKARMSDIAGWTEPCKRENTTVELVSQEPGDPGPTLSVYLISTPVSCKAFSKLYLENFLVTVSIGQDGNKVNSVYRTY